MQIKPSAQARGNSNVIQINDGGGYGTTAKSASTTPNPMPSAQARGNQHVVQLNDGGGYGKATTKSTQPFRNPLALGGPNPYTAAQRLNQATAALEQAQAKYNITAQHDARQTSYRPHGNNDAYREARRNATTAGNNVDALNREIENITGVSGSDRINLTFNGALTGMGASYAGAGGTALKGLDSVVRMATDEDILSKRGEIAAQQYKTRRASYKPHGDNSTNRAARAETRRLRQELSELTAQKESEAIENQLGLMRTASALDAEYERLAQKSTNDIARAKLGRPAAERFLIDATVAGTQVAADGLANVIVPGSSIALKGVRSFGDASQEARRAGASVGEQIAYGALTAGKDVAIEKAFDGLGGAYGKGFWDKTKAFPAVKEGAEAFASTMMQPINRSIYSGEVNYTPDVWTDALRNAAIKGTASGIINAWSDAQNRALDKAYDTAMQH